MQVVPRTHIRNVSGLRKEHLPTLDMMLEASSTATLPTWLCAVSCTQGLMGVACGALCGRQVGQKVVRERSPDSDPSTHQYVFHVPPFNSIDHLHLHCQVPG